MLEALRRDLPYVRNKARPEAVELFISTGTEAVLPVIEESAEQLDCKRK